MTVDWAALGAHVLAEAKGLAGDAWAAISDDEKALALAYAGGLARFQLQAFMGVPVPDADYAQLAAQKAMIRSELRDVIEAAFEKRAMRFLMLAGKVIGVLAKGALA